MERHYDEIQCPSWYGIWDPDEIHDVIDDDDVNNVLAPLRDESLVKALNKKAALERENYECFKVNKKVFTTTVANSSADNKMKCLGNAVKDLTTDLSLERDLSNKNKCYFGFFYINLLRKCLEILSLPVNAREIHMKLAKNVSPHTTDTSSDGTEQVTNHGAIRKVDLVVNDGTDVYLMLESARGKK